MNKKVIKKGLNSVLFCSNKDKEVSVVSIERRHPHGEERGLGNPVHVLKEQYLEKCARDILIGIRTANASGHLGLDPEAIAEL
jgi:hypothetical protein